MSQARLTRPVAPQHASRASSISTPLPPATSSWAANVPVMPLPTTTRSAVDGRPSVVRWPSSFLHGSRCQYESVLLVVGGSACSPWGAKPVMVMIPAHDCIEATRHTLCLNSNCSLDPPRIPLSHWWTCFLGHLDGSRDKARLSHNQSQTGLSLSVESSACCCRNEVFAPSIGPTTSAPELNPLMLFLCTPYASTVEALAVGYC